MKMVVGTFQALRIKYFTLQTAFTSTGNCGEKYYRQVQESYMYLWITAPQMDNKSKGEVSTVHHS